MKAEVLRNLTYGVFAVGVKDLKGKPSASIVTSVMQVAGMTQAGSALVAISLNKGSFTCDCIEKTGVFSISVLSQETPATVIGALGYVSGKRTDKLENVRHKVLMEGVPVIREKTCCWFLCQVKERLEIRGQRLFVAEIVAGSEEASGTPMTFSYYSSVLGGTEPLRSPLYLPPELTTDSTGGDSFICSVCGYVYSDPSFGFEELPADWVCPICKMPKKAFVRRK